MRTLLITALGIVTFTAQGATPQPAQEAASAPPTINAKALFFGSDNQVVVAPTAAPTTQPTKMAAAQQPKRQPKAPDTKAGLGASYFVRLQRQDGTTRDVLASHDFRTGERFQIGVRVNKPVHVYIYNQEANGNIAVLYQRCSTSRSATSSRTAESGFGRASPRASKPCSFRCEPGISS